VQAKHADSGLSCPIWRPGFIVVNGSGRQELITVLERIEKVLFVLFVPNGMYIDVLAFKAAGLLILLIIAGRKIGKYSGARIGAPEPLRKFPRLLLPKAGLPLGLAFMSQQAFPSFSPLLFNALVASTVINMLLTPPLARYALIQSGEARTMSPN